ncbi:hypothetical protein [Desulfurivibrio alkaliphilus]|nr:hypothetical protein [Desulfurivibrio alkaliphilus]
MSVNPAITASSRKHRRPWLLCGGVLTISLMLVLSWPAPPPAAAAPLPPVAVFPLQELKRDGSDVNLEFTNWLAQTLAAAGNEIIDQRTVINFMAFNRIRTAGYLESFYLHRAGEELGVPLVLLGTVSQLREQPLPSLGLTLQLVRTSDARTIWSYVGHLSAADVRRPLAVGEPGSVAELRALLARDLLEQWPWAQIRELRRASMIHLDSVLLQPQYVRPGEEVQVQVRLRSEWLPHSAPRIFFLADDQVHAAVRHQDGSYRASWPAGDKDGRFPVNLMLEWTHYNRRETAALGAYLVDGSPPLLTLELKGEINGDETPMFRNRLLIQPRLLVPKPLAKWRLSFEDESGHTVGSMEQPGNLPEVLVWQGMGNEGRLYSGTYQVVVEVQDLAGNRQRVSQPVELQRSTPGVALSAAREEQEIMVDLRQHDGRVPLDFWRLETWTREGRLLKTAEGRELPARVELALPSAEAGEAGAEIQGRLVVRDVLGNQSRRDLNDFFRTAAGRPPAQEAEEQPAGMSESWVDEF